jgi:hypothetical protein
MKIFLNFFCTVFIFYEIINNNEIGKEKIMSAPRYFILSDLYILQMFLYFPYFSNKKFIQKFVFFTRL